VTGYGVPPVTGIILTAAPPPPPPPPEHVAPSPITPPAAPPPPPTRVTLTFVVEGGAVQVCPGVVDVNTCILLNPPEGITPGAMLGAVIVAGAICDPVIVPVMLAAAIDPKNAVFCVELLLNDICVLFELIGITYPLYSKVLIFPFE